MWFAGVLTRAGADCRGSAGGCGGHGYERFRPRRLSRSRGQGDTSVAWVPVGADHRAPHFLGSRYVADVCPGGYDPGAVFFGAAQPREGVRHVTLWRLRNFGLRWASLGESNLK